MTTIDDLEKVMLTEIELTEALIEVLAAQREAVVCVEPENLNGAVDKGEELVQPIEALEQERLRITDELWQELGGGISEKTPTVSQLAERLSTTDAARVAGLGTRLRSSVEQILTINRDNKPLIENALKFVRENMRIIRESYPEGLVDHRM